MEKNLLFEEKIQYYSMKKLERIIIAPDVIVESEGVACGDKLKLALAIIDNECLFSINSEGCSVCTATSNFLMDELYGKDESTIYNFITKILDEQYDDRTEWIREAPIERKLCIRTPLKLLQEAISSFNPQCAITSSAKLLACDACVKSFTINWGSQEMKCEQKKKNFRDLIREVNSLNDVAEMKLQPLGKSVLSEYEIEELKEVMENMDRAKYKKIKKLRLSMLYRNNSEKYFKGVKSNDVMLLSKKQIISKSVTMLEINKINQEIIRNNWKVSKVKGARTADYYDKELYRTHLDYDYIASDIKDGFLFIDYLINQEGFKFVIGGSVPFSLKIVDDYDKKETLTGHLHLEKIMQDAFQIVVDINLGGFPLGRTGIVKLNEKNIVSIEEQFVITLCHVFKHEIVFMKDINDIYYILKSKQIDFQKLSKLIDLNELQLYFYILMKYINKNFDIPEVKIKKYATIKNKLIYEFQGKMWPYSRKNHFWIKFQDTIIRCIKSNGFTKGIKEAYKQCMGKEMEGIPTEIYRGINLTKNTRTYLYPAVLFNKSLTLDKLHEDKQYEEVVKDCIYRYNAKQNNIIITSFGVFISQEKMNESKNRAEVIYEVTEILSKLKINVDCINQGYIMQARQDLWLY